MFASVYKERSRIRIRRGIKITVRYRIHILGRLAFKDKPGGVSSSRGLANGKLVKRRRKNIQLDLRSNFQKCQFGKSCHS